MSETPIGDSLDPDLQGEPDPPEFDRSKVPDGPLADFFFSGRTGRGLTDAEWDEQRRRWREHGWDPFKEES